MAVLFPRVAIVVLNFNGRDCLLPCLESLFRLRYPNFFIVVVDNASQDDSLARAEQRFPGIITVRHHENKGFAAGMNVGMQLAFERGADWAWLFNNDAIADEHALQCLMDVATQEAQAGLLSPFIYSASADELWFGGGRVNALRMRVVHTPPSSSQRRSGQPYQSEFLTGCALLVSKKVFSQVGKLDERFFLYYEDADFSLRAKEHGFTLLVVPAARVWHREQSGENPEKLYHLVLSGLLFFEKHATWWQRPYFSAYGTIRRIKNAWDLIFWKSAAVPVRRAYDSFFHGR